MGRCIANRIHGDGATQTDILDYDLPIQGLTITENLSGAQMLEGSISPEILRLQGDDGLPTLKPWQTEIFHEDPDGTLIGGILRPPTQYSDGKNFTLECTGYPGYLIDTPYTNSWFGVEIDPLDVVRQIWDHVQSKPRGNLGLQVSDLKTGLKVGVELEQVEFDTQSGPVSFEAGPVKLNWYTTHNLAETVDKLAEETPFDYVESHRWEGDDKIAHYLDFGYQKIGRKRDDLRFAIGENVIVIPQSETSDEDYATEVLVLGAGEGRTMKKAFASRPSSSGVRRVAVVTDKKLRSARACTIRARRELAWRIGMEDIGEIVMEDHPNARISQVRVGDEIRVQGHAGWITHDMWVRVHAKRRQPNDTTSAVLTVARADKM